MLINCNENESSESLITNIGVCGKEPEVQKEDHSNKQIYDWMTRLTEKAKDITQGISKDMRDFDASFNNLLFGQVDFDRSFLEQNHTKSVEWIKFTSTKGIRPVPDVIKQSLLTNNIKLSNLYESSVGKIIDEEEFWAKWQFYCFIRDRRDKKKTETFTSNRSAESVNLIKEKEVLQLEEWD